LLSCLVLLLLLCLRLLLQNVLNVGLAHFGRLGGDDGVTQVVTTLHCYNKSELARDSLEFKCPYS
jgi:hypothetical protein